MKKSNDFIRLAYVRANQNRVLSSTGGSGGRERERGREVEVWPGSCGEAEGLHVEGRVGGRAGWQRRTVVFHSHYRNVLPCALVAPRNKSSVTVTTARWGGEREREERRGMNTRGLLWRLNPPSVPVRFCQQSAPFATIATTSFPRSLVSLLIPPPLPPLPPFTLYSTSSWLDPSISNDFA